MLFNGIVKCTKSNSCAFTEGNVYKIKNGLMETDYPNHQVGCRFKTIKQINTVMDSQFEVIKDNLQEITIMRDGRKVVAVCNGKAGIARCNPIDEFDFIVGAKLAFERLIEKLDKFNGIICCYHSETPYYTVGKLYEVKNNIFIDDAGYDTVYQENVDGDRVKFVKVVEHGNIGRY